MYRRQSYEVQWLLFIIKFKMHWQDFSLDNFNYDKAVLFRILFYSPAISFSSRALISSSLRSACQERMKKNNENKQVFWTRFGCLTHWVNISSYTNLSSVWQFPPFQWRFPRLKIKYKNKIKKMIHEVPTSCDRFFFQL